jgi:zinc protease
MFGEEMMRILWNNQLYGRPVSGTEEEIATLTREDAQAFYRRYYAPNRAVLILSGDLTLQDAKRLAEKYFAPISSRQDAEDETASQNDFKTQQSHYRFEKSLHWIRTPRVVRQWLVPSMLTDPTAAFALEVFASYLGNGDSSYLNRHLVWTQKMVAADASYDSLKQIAGVFELGFIPLTDEQTPEAEALLEPIVRQALEDLDEQTLEREKAKISAHLVYVNDNPEDAAMMVGEWLSAGLPLEQLESYEESLRAVNLFAVYRAVTNMLQSSTEMVGVLHPMPLEDREKE